MTADQLTIQTMQSWTPRRQRALVQASRNQQTLEMPAGQERKHHALSHLVGILQAAQLAPEVCVLGQVSSGLTWLAMKLKALGMS